MNQEKWLKQPVVDANGVLIKEDSDKPFTKQDYVVGFYTRIEKIIERNGYNIISTNKLKKDLSRFIYNYSH